MISRTNLTVDELWICYELRVDKQFILRLHKSGFDNKEIVDLLLTFLDCGRRHNQKGNELWERN